MDNIRRPGSNEYGLTMRALWLLLGLLSVAAGAAGILLPLVPTTPFLLLAAYAFARSSPRLEHWLLTHRQFGPIIENWRRYGMISRRAKILATIMMVAAFILSVFLGAGRIILITQAIVLCGAASFVLSRPEKPTPPRKTNV